MWEDYTSDAAWEPHKWEINIKVCKDLANNPFGNVMRDYGDWSAHMVNHLVACNQGYGKILHVLQKGESARNIRET